MGRRDRIIAAGTGLARILLVAAFAVAMFLAGHLWSIREVREARRAAGLAEEERLALEAELHECRNTVILLRRRAGSTGAGVPPGDRTDASRRGSETTP